MLQKETKRKLAKTIAITIARINYRVSKEAELATIIKKNWWYQYHLVICTENRCSLFQDGFIQYMYLMCKLFFRSECMKNFFF